MNKDFFKQVIDLENSIEYSDNAIVSKTVYSKEHNSVTLFSFDAGETIAAHTAPADAIVLILDGEAEIIISDETFYLKRGQIIIMPEGEPHAINSITKFKMALFKI